MKHLDDILKLAENELAAISANGKFRSREEIDSVYKLIDIAKDSYEIWCMEDDMESSSYDGGSYRGYPNSYDGNSYARGRGRYAKRDSMGRYSRDGYRDGSYRGYSRGDDKQEYIENLRDMMSAAPDENTRQSMQRIIDQMQH